MQNGHLDKVRFNGLFITEKNPEFHWFKIANTENSLAIQKGDARSRISLCL